MKTIKLTNVIDYVGYYATSPLFGLLDKDYKSIYQYGMCKEYILDYTLAEFTLKGDVDATRILTKGIPNIFCSLDLLQKFEERLELSPTVMLDGDNGRVVFQGDKKWTIAPPMLSLYTLLIRSGGSLHNVKNKSIEDSLNFIQDKPASQDRNYVVHARKGIDYILKNGLKIFHPQAKDNWLGHKPISIHRAGIITFSENPQQYLTKYLVG